MGNLRRGASLCHAIYAAVRRIPRGRMASYGQVAGRAGLLGQVRLVGYALHNLPPDSDVPWHLVVNALGGISLDKRWWAYLEKGSPPVPPFAAQPQVAEG